MYFFLLTLHSLFRWLVVCSLVYAVYTAYQGVSRKLPFTARANRIRHWTATIAHIQLLLGMSLYIQSPVVLFRMADAEGSMLKELVFFRFIHLSLMLTAVGVITTGSAKAKRLQSDQEKYKTMIRWFIAGLLIIFIAIPWPFSPLAARPLIRPF